jgi:vacuolar-type H+-ATPase subunit F/Vma7
MNALILFITFLILFVIGSAALALAVLLFGAIGVYTHKAARLLIALLNAAIKEPEEKIIARIHKLSKKVKSEKKKVTSVIPASAVIPAKAGIQKKKK